jgi:hypothetical protein
VLVPGRPLIEIFQQGYLFKHYGSWRLNTDAFIDGLFHRGDPGEYNHDHNKGKYEEEEKTQVFHNSWWLLYQHCTKIKRMAGL